MTMEENYLLHILSDFLNNRETIRPQEQINFKELFRVAKIHQIEGIIYKQCKGFLDSDFERQVAPAYNATLFCYVNRLATVKSVEKVLDAEYIPHFIIKGVSIAEYYPVPALRTMGDIDIVVPTKDRAKVHEIILDLGFQNESRIEDREWIYCKNGMEFELHDQLVYNENINKIKHEDYFNDFWKYTHNCELDWSFHFLFLVLHLRKHLMNSGVGFRQFMDIAVLARYNTKLDWSWITEELDKLELLDFTKTIFAFIRSWFVIIPPIPVRELDEEFYELTSERIIRNGVFGFDNKENDYNAAINNSLAGKSNIAVALRKVFPSHNVMIRVPHYVFLQGKPYLLPIAWIYRFIRGVKSGHANDKAIELKKSFASKEMIEKRSNMFKKWGL